MIKFVPITVGLTFSYYCENYQNFVDTSRGQAATIWPTQGSAQEIVTFYTISISAFVPAWKLLKRFGIKMNESNCISWWSVMSNLQLKSIYLKMVWSTKCPSQLCWTLLDMSRDIQEMPKLAKQLVHENLSEKFSLWLQQDIFYFTFYVYSCW